MARGFGMSFVGMPDHTTGKITEDSPIYQEFVDMINEYLPIVYEHFLKTTNNMWENAVVNEKKKADRREKQQRDMVKFDERLQQLQANADQAMELEKEKNKNSKLEKKASAERQKSLRKIPKTPAKVTDKSPIKKKRTVKK